MSRTPESIISRIRRGEGRPAVKEVASEEGLVPLVPLGVLMLIFLVNCVVGFAFLEEDAFIDFRYVRNLAEGFGFVFNPGGEPVEGFSNFLWLGILYFAYVAGFEVVAAARIICIILGLGAIYFSCKAMIRLTGRDGALNLLPAAMIAFSPPLIYWYQGGLEAPLFSFLIIGALYLHLEESKRVVPFPLSGLFCLLLALTRPEGIIFFVIFAMLKTPPAMRDNAKLRSFIVWFFSCFLPFLLFIAIRFNIFHSLLPNTYYAKVNYAVPDAVHIGGLYTLAFLLDSRAWLWLVPYIAVLIRVRGESLWRSLLPLILFVPYMLFVFYVGGDFHIHFRFYAPMLPLLFMAAAMGLWEIYDLIGEHSATRVANIATAFLALIVLVGSSAYYRSPVWRDLEQVAPGNRSLLSYRYEMFAKQPSQFGTLLRNWFKPPGDILDKAGKWLAGEYPEDTRIATEQCGKVPFYTGFETFDLLGLNDKEVARIIHYSLSFQKYLDAFLQADSDIVLLYYADGRFVDMLHIGKLVESKEFQEKYELTTILDFDYVYKLDKDYHRDRQLLLFERRIKPAEISAPLKINAMIDDFAKTATVEEGVIRKPGEQGEAAKPKVIRKRIIKFVVEL